MTLSRVTRCALLLVPLFVCAGRLHGHRGGVPAGALQEVNRCLSVVRAVSRRRHQEERNQPHAPGPLGLSTDHGGAMIERAAVRLAVTQIR